MDREQGLPRMAPFTPPCLRGVLPPQLLPRSDIRMDLDGPRARSATHGSLHSALPTWGSPSAAAASLFCDIRMDLDGPRARSATHGYLHSALPTWGSPSAASASFLQGGELDVHGPRARSATHGSLHSALPTWGSPSAASSPSSVDVVATHVQSLMCTKSDFACKCNCCKQHSVETSL